MRKVKNIIVDLILLLCPVLMFVFMSQPYLTKTGVLINGTISNGYNFISFEGDGAADFNAVCLILICVFASILILLALISLLNDFSIIRTKKAGKIIEILKVVSIMVLLLATIGSLITIASQFTVSTEVASIIVGWAVIVNMIVAFVLLLTYLVSLIGKLRKK